MLGFRFIKFQPSEEPFPIKNSGIEATITVAEKKGHLVV
jgi:hypothetical protein